MYLFDIIIIMFLLIFAVVGFKNGFFKQTVKTVGVILIFVFAFYFKDYVADFLSYTLPFIKFKGSIAELIRAIQDFRVIKYYFISINCIFDTFRIIFHCFSNIT